MKFNSKYIFLFVVIFVNTLCVLSQNKPVKCKKDSDCRKAGLVNSYCRDEKKVASVLRHHSECQPKRSWLNILMKLLFSKI